MHEKLSQIRAKGIKEIDEASSSADLNSIRLEYFGKKGLITQLMRGLGTLSPEERPVVGKLVNELRKELEETWEKKNQAILHLEAEAKLEKERIDVELPGRKPRRGNQHPLSAIIQEITEVFLGMGFSVAEGLKLRRIIITLKP